MIALIFAGQGAQKPGMGKSLYESSLAAKQVFDQASEALGKDVKALCFDSPQEELNQTINTQPALFVCDYAAAAALEEKGVKAGVCAGFSLGEYAALVCADVLPLGEASKLIQSRAEAMSEVQQGGMMAVLGLAGEEVEALCREVSGYVVPVNYNCPGQVVVAGEDIALEELSAKLKEMKKRAMPLKVSGAFHSKFMEPAGKVLRKELDKVSFAEPKIPLVGNLTAEILPGELPWPEILQRQCSSPVLWQQSIEKMLSMGVTTFIECGPGKVLAGLNKKICPDVPTYSVGDEESLQACLEALGA